MADIDDEIYQFYSSQGIVSDPGKLAYLLDSFPDDIGELCHAIQGLVIHICWMDRYGAQTPKERREKEVNLRAFERQLKAIIEMDYRPLSIKRPMEKRLVGNCRDFTLFFVSILRHKGIPARARCGFGVYFMPGKYEDHWVAEYWDDKANRWVMVDAQLDDFQKEKLAIQFDPQDMAPGMFITGGEAWRKCREGKSDPMQFGIFEMRGLDFIGGDLVRDFLALNKVEILPWDDWPAIKSQKDFTQDLLALLDHMAELTNSPDINFNKIRRLYESNMLLRPAANWKP
jgi:hypothetical protein